MNKWDLNDILVNGIQPHEEREPWERNYIWASEIGYPMFDRFHKMKGTPPSNGFTARTQFKFLVGSAIEYALQRMFERSGMTVEVQKGADKCVVKTPGLLPVSGKYDAIISANGDWDKAIWEIKNNPLPDIESFVDRYALNIAQYCQEKYPGGFDREIFEIKTMNSMVFRSKINSGTLEKDYYHHQLQLYTYMQHLGFKSGKVFYVSKDDGLFFVVDVVESDKIKKDWLNDVESITNYVVNKIEPEFPEPYTFSNGKYKMNWYAIGSMYLTLKTGKTQEEFEQEVSAKVRELNNEAKRVEKAKEQAIKDEIKAKEKAIKQAEKEKIKKEKAEAKEKAKQEKKLNKIKPKKAEEK